MTAADPVAARAGIAAGLSLADARALLPGLATAAADPEGDARALAQLADWCRRYTPWTRPDGADGLLLDVSGCAHLLGGEDRLLADLARRLAGFGLTARLAIADTPGAAWAAARYAAAPAAASAAIVPPAVVPPAIVPPGAQRAALAPLPVEGLGLPAAAATALRRLGLRRIGDLYPLPRAPLAARLGAAVLERLDQALGAAPEPVMPLRPAPSRRARIAFPEPIATAEAIAAALGRLLDDLCRRLAATGEGARRLELALFRTDGTLIEIAVGTARAGRDPAQLARLFAERLGGVDPGFGIELALLSLVAAEPLAAVQPALARLAPPESAPPEPAPPEPAPAGSAPGAVPRPRPAAGASSATAGTVPIRARPPHGCAGGPPPRVGEAAGAVPARDGPAVPARSGPAVPARDGPAAPLAPPGPPARTGMPWPRASRSRASSRAPSLAAAPEGSAERATTGAVLAAAAALAPLVDRLQNRLGRGALYRPVPQGSAVPERAVARAQPLAAARADAATAGAVWPAAEAERPLRLLRVPEPVEAAAPVPDDPPILFRWRRVLHRVRRADGPERIAAEWWREEGGVRDYYRVEDEAGRRFWLFRVGGYGASRAGEGGAGEPGAAAPPRWFLHGFFA